MPKAELKVMDIDLHYKCPNCYLMFKLRNKQIPIKKSLIQDCPACSDALTIAPVSINVSEVSSRARHSSKTKDKTVCKAVEALKSQGYSTKESRIRVNAAHEKGISLADLIKGAINYDELS